MRLYEKTSGKNGYVSVGINPRLAHDTPGTIEEARKQWAAVNRPNILINVPATTEGLAAIRQLISEGINVHATLIFGLPRYRQVIEAYITGIGARIGQGRPVSEVASAASFLSSPIDSAIDPIEEEFAAQGGEQAQSDIRYIEALIGEGTVHLEKNIKSYDRMMAALARKSSAYNIIAERAERKMKKRKVLY